VIDRSFDAFDQSFGGFEGFDQLPGQLQSNLDEALDATSDPIADVAKKFELDPRRVRILPAGVLILEKLSELLGQPLQIGKGGLREGIILDLLNNGSENGAPAALAA